MYVQGSKNSSLNAASSSNNTSKTRLNVKQPVTMRQTFTQDYQKFTTNIAQRVHSREATLRQSDVQNTSHGASINNSQTALLRPNTSSGHGAMASNSGSNSANITLIGNKENSSLNLVIGANSKGDNNINATSAGVSGGNRNLRNTNQSLMSSTHNETRATAPAYFRSTVQHHDSNTMTLQMASRSGTSSGADQLNSGKRAQALSQEPESNNFAGSQVLKRPASKQQTTGGSSTEQTRRRYPHQQTHQTGATRRLNEEIQQKIQVLTNSIGQIKPESLNRSGSTTDEQRIGQLKSGVHNSNHSTRVTTKASNRSSGNLSRFTSGFQNQQKHHAIVTPQTLKPQVELASQVDADGKYKPIQISKRQGHGSREPTKTDRFIGQGSALPNKPAPVQITAVTSTTDYSQQPSIAHPDQQHSHHTTTVQSTVQSTTNSDQNKEVKRSRTSEPAKGAVSNAAAVALAAKRIQSSLRSGTATSSTQNIIQKQLTAPSMTKTTVASQSTSQSHQQQQQHQQQVQQISDNRLNSTAGDSSMVAITTQASSSTGKQHLNNTTTNTNASASSTKIASSSAKALPLTFDEKIQAVHAVAEERRKDRMKALTRNFEVCDLLDMRNVQTIAEHAPKITQFLLQEENRFMLNSNFMKNQTNGVTEKMRAFLVDWLAELHFKFKMWAETLYVTIGIVDKYLAIQTGVSKQELQVLGIAALLIAGKYEEIYPPDLKTILKVINNVVTKEEVLKMERRVLMALQFDVTFPSIHRFIERFARLAQMSERQVLLAQYFADTALLDCSLVREKPSRVAACCIYASQTIFKGPSQQKGVLWNSMLSKHTGYRESEISGMATDLLVFVSKVEQSTFKTMRKKYSSTRFSEVAKLMQNVMQ